MTEEEAREAVRTAVECSGGLRSLARAWGVSPSYLSDCCNGRRAPGPAVLRHMGIVRRVVTTYEPDPAAKDWPTTRKALTDERVAEIRAEIERELDDY